MAITCTVDDPAGVCEEGGGEEVPQAVKALPRIHSKNNISMVWILALKRRLRPVSIVPKRHGTQNRVASSAVRWYDRRPVGSNLARVLVVIVMVTLVELLLPVKLKDDG